MSGNDICGNFSLEYGAGVSVYGLSPNGSVHHNRITLNNSNDEGAGVMIAGQLPANPDDLSPGSGPVNIYANQIQGNLANDDGGGIRFLMAGNFPMNVLQQRHREQRLDPRGRRHRHQRRPGRADLQQHDHEQHHDGHRRDVERLPGTRRGVHLREQPAAAGHPGDRCADLQQAAAVQQRAVGQPGRHAGPGPRSLGIGLDGDVTPVDHWDVGVADGTGVLEPVNSVIQQSSGDARLHRRARPTSTADPKVVEPWALSVSFATWRQNAAFVDANVVAVEAPPDLMGDYHLQACTGAASSPACNLGASSRGGVNAPALGHRRRHPALAAAASTPAPTRSSRAVAGTQPRTSCSPPSGNSEPAGSLRHARTTRTSTAGTARRTAGRSTSPPRQRAASRPGANVDGFAQQDATTFYLSFADDTTLPGIGAVQDEDVVQVGRQRLVGLLRRHGSAA